MPDTKKVKVYVSGKMRGVRDYNRIKFAKWTRKLNEEGYEAVNPFKVGEKFGRPEDIEKDHELFAKVFDADMKALAECDAIFMMNGWATSSGAKCELLYALEHNMVIMTESEHQLSDNEKIDSACEILEGLTNVYGCRKNLEEIANRMAHMHRTLVQSFAGGFIIPFVRELAHMKRADRFDGRNKASCEACLFMSEALEEKYGICEADDFAFPLI